MLDVDTVDTTIPTYSAFLMQSLATGVSSHNNFIIYGKKTSMAALIWKGVVYRYRATVDINHRFTDVKLTPDSSIWGWWIWCQLHVGLKPKKVLNTYHRQSCDDDVFRSLLLSTGLINERTIHSSKYARVFYALNHFVWYLYKAVTPMAVKYPERYG